MPDVASTNGTEFEPDDVDSLYSAPLPFGPAASVYPDPAVIVPAESHAPAYASSPAAVELTVLVGFAPVPLAWFDWSAGLAGHPTEPENSEMTRSRSATDALVVIVTELVVAPDAFAMNSCVRIPGVANVHSDPAIGVQMLPCRSVSAHVAVVLAHAAHASSRLPGAVLEPNACASVVPAEREKLLADC